MQEMDPNDEDTADQKRRPHRALTQRYDMHALKKFQQIEDEFRKKMAILCDCEADDVPVDLDTLSIYNEEPGLRRAALVEAFRRAPPEKNYNDIIDQLLKDLSELVITPISSKK